MKKTKGAFLIARNNSSVDYVKQAVFLAKRIKKYLDIPTTILTDSVEYLESEFNKNIFDKIIPLKQPQQQNEKLYFDGAMYQKLAMFNNRSRCQVYELPASSLQTLQALPIYQWVHIQDLAGGIVLM